MVGENQLGLFLTYNYLDLDMRKCHLSLAWYTVLKRGLDTLTQIKPQPS
jgi:hypothetical protein